MKDIQLIPKPNGTYKLCEQKYTYRNKPDEEIKIVCDTTLEEEEYKLSVNEQGIRVTAATDQAVKYALTTIRLLTDEAQFVPYCEIHDKPKYRHRGLMIDCVRHFFPREELERIIEQMALVKMNVLHLHLSDDQGWRIESRCFPELHQQPGNEYYSREDIRAIVAFAESRGVELIPELDIPGHVSALLAAYPGYSCSGKKVEIATCGGIYPTILCAGNERTYEMLETLLDEMCPLFCSEQFHIGGDEAPKKEWQKCKCCQNKIRTEGLADEKELQGYFSNRVMDILGKHGKKPICWNDSLEADNLYKKTKIQFWSVQYAEHMPEYMRNGGELIYSDMFTFYFDYPYSMTPLQRVYNDPLEIQGVSYEKYPGLTGIEACIWAEHIDGPDRLEELLFPRLYALAEKAWSEELGYEAFKQRLRVFLERSHPADMKVTSEKGWDPRGKERQQDTFAYFAGMNSAMPEDVRRETVESAAPNKMFEEKFMNCFFQPEDIPLLMGEKEPEIKVHKYEEREYQQVQEVCIATGQSGIFEQKEMQGVLLTAFCHYYIEQEPDNCFTALDEDKVVGYILCAENAGTWAANFQHIYTEQQANSALNSFYQGLTEVPLRYAAEYPAHLHIDILPDYQRRGIGFKLMDTLVTHLKEKGVPGLMLSVAIDNEKGINFYKKYGFTILEKTPREIVMGVRL